MSGIYKVSPHPHSIGAPVMTDVTEGVQIAYDTVLASLDWGSGFLDHDEMCAIIQLGITCGFKLPELDDSGPERAVAERFLDHYERVVMYERPDGVKRYAWRQKP